MCADAKAFPAAGVVPAREVDYTYIVASSLL
jgi:hypothetical protein